MLTFGIGKRSICSSTQLLKKQGMDSAPIFQCKEFLPGLDLTWTLTAWNDITFWKFCRVETVM